MTPVIRGQLDRFRDRWRFYRDVGQVELMRQVHGQRRLVEMVRSDLDRALCPPPTGRRADSTEWWDATSSPLALDSPWREVSDADLAAWRHRHPHATCRDHVARQLAWLEREFGRG